MRLKAQMMDESQLKRTMARIAHEIIEKNDDPRKICLLGIKRRGIPLAKMLQENIERFEGVQVPLGTIDISLYRDDLTEIAPLGKTGESNIPIALSAYTVILVDDVLYTGRTARAAIEAVFKHGRPQAIQLAVLIDRGHRELPIRPDYVGKNIPTSHQEVIKVLIPEFDQNCGVELYSLE